MDKDEKTKPGSGTAWLAIQVRGGEPTLQPLVPEGEQENVLRDRLDGLKLADWIAGHGNALPDVE